MKNTQQGFTVIEILLSFTVLALISFIMWNAYSYQQTHSSTKSSQPQATEKTQVPYEDISAETVETETLNWKSYSRYGITFKYPADWTLDAKNTSQSDVTEVSSPELVTIQGQEGVEDYQLPKLSVSIDDFDFTGTDLNADNFKEKSLDAGPNPYSEYRQLTINEKKAVQSRWENYMQTVFFLPSDKQVMVMQNTDSKSTKPSREYELLIRTVRY